MNLKEIRQEIQEKINEADMILVGIGKELDTDREFADKKEIISETEIKERILKEAEDVKKFNREEFFTRCFSVWQKKQGEKMNKALLHLKEMLEGKNYFVISTNVDECLYQTGFRYLVTPCGRESVFQCSKNCSNEVWENEEYLKRIFLEQEPQESLPQCPFCGAKADFNMIKQNKKQYCEQGYLLEWEKYLKWLSGTLNKKLLLLDFGSDFLYPQLIRWAFERIALWNQKAFLVRVHRTLSNVPEELKERSCSFAEDSRILLEE